MTWKEISDLKHELQALNSSLAFMIKKIGQMQFNLESAIRKKAVEED